MSRRPAQAATALKTYLLLLVVVVNPLLVDTLVVLDGADNLPALAAVEFDQLGGRIPGVKQHNYLEVLGKHRRQFGEHGMSQCVFAAAMQAIFRLAVTVQFAGDTLPQVQSGIPGKADPAHLDMDFDIHKTVDILGFTFRSIIVVVVKAHGFQMASSLVFLPLTIIRPTKILASPTFLANTRNCSNNMKMGSPIRSAWTAHLHTGGNVNV
jgi:hypothetical protein